MEYKYEKYINLIDKYLSGKIQDNCCYLDVPNYSNTGDMLIYLGACNYLKHNEINIYYQSSINYFKSCNVKPDTTILLQGGGNFGDLYKLHQDYRGKIIKEYRNNKIIIFPVSVFYEHENNLINDAKLFAQHPDLTICARDKESFKILNDYFNNKIILIPDMSLYIGSINTNNSNKTNNILFLKRLDKELGCEKYSIEENINVDVKDWPYIEKQYKNTDYIYKLKKLLNYKVTEIVQNIGINYYINDVYGYINADDSLSHINSAVKLLNKYNLVITTRLHGLILSLIMNKSVILIDNSNRKNSSFYNTWLYDIDNAYYARDEKQLWSILEGEFKRYL